MSDGLSVTRGDLAAPVPVRSRSAAVAPVSAVVVVVVGVAVEPRAWVFEVLALLP